MVINADDLGASDEINEAIFGLMRLGLVRSSTIIANGNAVESAVRQAAGYPRCSFGVHLNLTEFRPLTSQPELTRLLDSEGRFAKHALRAMRITAGLREELLVELSAQVEKVSALGLHISHFDSHHHIHTIPALFGVLKRLQKRFGIRKVRASMNLYSSPLPASSRVAKSIWNAALRRVGRTVTTDVFASVAVFAEVAGRLTSWPSSIELMCHPGAAQYEAETQLLRSDLWNALPQVIEFVSYNQL